MHGSLSYLYFMCIPSEMVVLPVFFVSVDMLRLASLSSSLSHPHSDSRKYNLYSMECIKVYSARAHISVSTIFIHSRTFHRFALESNVSCNHTTSCTIYYSEFRAFYFTACAACTLYCGWTNANQPKENRNGDGAWCWWSGSHTRNSARVGKKNNNFLIKYIEWRCMHASIERRKNW